MTDVIVVLISLNACPKMGAGNLKIQELMIPVFAVFYFLPFDNKLCPNSHV